MVGSVAEHGRLFAELVDDTLEQAQRTERDRLRLGQRRQHAITAGDVEWRVHAARHRPGWMDTFLRQALDRLLAELAQRDAFARELRMILDDAE